MSKYSSHVLVLILTFIIWISGLAYLRSAYESSPEKRVHVRNGEIVRDARGNPLAMGWERAKSGQLAIWTVVCGAGSLGFVIWRDKHSP